MNQIILDERWNGRELSKCLANESFLFDGETLCCMGFYCIERGKLSLKEIRGLRQILGNVNVDFIKSKDLTTLYGINDNAYINPERNSSRYSFNSIQEKVQALNQIASNYNFQFVLSEDIENA